MMLIRNLGTFGFVFSFFAQRMYVDLGFALKGFMIFALFYTVANLSKIKLFVIPADKFYLVFIAYATLTVPFSHDLGSGLRYVLGSILILYCSVVFRSLLISPSITNETLDKLVVKAGLAFTITSFVFYIVGLMSFGSEYLSFEGQERFGVLIDRGVPRLIGIVNDPNIYVFYTLLFLFHGFANFGRGKAEKLLLGLSVSTVFLTFSRGGYLAVVGVSFVALIFKMVAGFRRNEFSVRKLFLILVASLATVLVIYGVWSSEMARLMLEKRFTSIGDGSGRFEIWAHAIDLWADHPIFGIGWANFLQYNTLYFGRPNYTHNTPLEVLVELGVVGMILYSLFLSSYLVTVCRCVRATGRNFYVVVFLCMLALMTSLSLLINEVFFAFLSLIVAYQFHAARHAAARPQEKIAE